MEIYGVDLWCHIHDVTHRVHDLLSQHWSGLKDEPVECTISLAPTRISEVESSYR